MNRVSDARASDPPANHPAADRRFASTIAYYDRHAAAYAAMTARMDVTSQLAHFANFLPVGAHVLDLGCGAGRDLSGLHEAGLQVEGVDASKCLAEIARARSGLPVAVADLRDLPFAPTSFDGLWAMASLLHVEEGDLRQALRGMLKILRPHGIFFSSVKRGHGLIQDEHGRWFTLHDESGWVAHLEASGFEIIEVGVDSSAAGTSDELKPLGWVSCLARRPA